jgi:hypothetical protein
MVDQFLHNSLLLGKRETYKFCLLDTTQVFDVLISPRCRLPRFFPYSHMLRPCLMRQYGLKVDERDDDSTLLPNYFAQCLLKSHNSAVPFVFTKVNARSRDHLGTQKFGTEVSR